MAMNDDAPATEQYVGHFFVQNDRSEVPTLNTNRISVM
jgi:hypothetical protein